MTDYPLSLVEFKSWLESKDENEIVGESHRTDCCPIANFLRLKTNAKKIQVRSYVTRADEYVTAFNPDWVTDFVIEVDSLEENQKSVIAKEALQILSNLYICTNCNKYNPEGKNCGKDNCDW